MTHHNHGRHEYTPDEEARLRALHLAGWTVRRIARALNRPRCGVKRKIERLGLGRARKRARLALVRKLWRRGLTDAEIALELGVSRSAVWLARRGLGLVARRGKEPRKGAA